MAARSGRVRLGYIGAQAHWRSAIPNRIAIGEDASALAERIGHPFSWPRSVVRLRCPPRRGEPEGVLADGRRLVAAERRAVASSSSCQCSYLLGWALTRWGDVAEAMSSREEGLGVIGPAGIRPFLSHSACRWARLYRRGRHAEGLAAGEREDLTRRRNRATRFEAELRRRRQLRCTSTARLRGGGALKRRCASRGGNRRKPMSCAPRRASPGFGANRAGAPKPAICSRRSTAGSPKASTPPT